MPDLGVIGSLIFEAMTLDEITRGVRVDEKRQGLRTESWACQCSEVRKMRRNQQKRRKNRRAGCSRSQEVTVFQREGSNQLASDAGKSRKMSTDNQL